MINNQLGLGDKMAMLGDGFNCRRLRQKKNNPMNFFLNRIFRDFAATAAALQTFHNKFLGRVCEDRLG